MTQNSLFDNYSSKQYKPESTVPHTDLYPNEDTHTQSLS